MNIILRMSAGFFLIFLLSFHVSCAGIDDDGNAPTFPVSTKISKALDALTSGGVKARGTISGTTTAIDPGIAFRVNTYTADWQAHPNVAMGFDGRFIISWDSDNQDGSNFGVFAQRYDASGNPLGPEFQVNSFTSDDQVSPAASMGPDGRFVITWQSRGQDGDGFGIYGQRYDPSGNPLGAEFQANSFTTKNQEYPSVAMGADDQFVVAWNSDLPDAGVYVRRFDTLGEPQGAEFRASANTAWGQWGATVAMGPDGRFIVAWMSDDQDGNWWGVYAQLFDASGSPMGSEFRINTFTLGAQGWQSVAMALDGRFVVAWQGENQDGDIGGINAQLYDPAGNPEGGNFRVNTYSTGYEVAASVAMASDGRFVVIWEGPVQTGGPKGVFAQRYDALGNPQGPQFLVNNYNYTFMSLENNSSISMAPDGRFVVTWHFINPAPDHCDVYAKRFDCITDADCPSDICTDAVCVTTTTTTSTTTSTSTSTTTSTSTSTSTTLITTTTTSTSTSTTTSTTTSTSTSTSSTSTTLSTSTSTQPPATTTSSTMTSTSTTTQIPTTTSTTVTTNLSTSTTVPSTTSTTTTTTAADDDTADEDSADDDTADDDTADDDSSEDTGNAVDDTSFVNGGDDVADDDLLSDDDLDAADDDSMAFGIKGVGGSGGCGC